jgi:Tfp pilus assembly protein FimT
MTVTSRQLPRSGGGFTVIELVIGGMILSIIAAIAFRGMQFAGRSVRMQESIEVGARLRNASFQLSRDLALATEILLPNQAAIDFSPLLIYKNQVNEVVAVFLSPDGLARYNYNLDQTQTWLPQATQFQCRLGADGLIEYQVTVAAEKRTFTLRNFLSTYQSLP